MNWASKPSRIARLRRTQARIERQYRPEPRYIVYRNGRPYKPRKAVKRSNQQLKEALLMICVVIVLAVAGMSAGWGIGG